MVRIVKTRPIKVKKWLSYILNIFINFSQSMMIQRLKYGIIADSGLPNMINGSNHEVRANFNLKRKKVSREKRSCSTAKPNTLLCSVSHLTFEIYATLLQMIYTLKSHVIFHTRCVNTVNKYEWCEIILHVRCIYIYI